MKQTDAGGFADRCKSQTPERKKRQQQLQQTPKDRIEQLCLFGVGLPSLPLRGQSEYTARDIRGNSKQRRNSSSKKGLSWRKTESERERASADLVDRRSPVFPSESLTTESGDTDRAL